MTTIIFFIKIEGILSLTAILACQSLRITVWNVKWEHLQPGKCKSASDVGKWYEYDVH